MRNWKFGLFQIFSPSSLKCACIELRRARGLKIWKFEYFADGEVEHLKRRTAEHRKCQNQKTWIWIIRHLAIRKLKMWKIDYWKLQNVETWNHNIFKIESLKVRKFENPKICKFDFEDFWTLANLNVWIPGQLRKCKLENMIIETLSISKIEKTKNKKNRNLEFWKLKSWNAEMLKIVKIWKHDIQNL